jgi:hypothetical protein
MFGIEDMADRGAVMDRIEIPASVGEFSYEVSQDREKS